MEAVALHDGREAREAGAADVGGFILADEEAVGTAGIAIVDLVQPQVVALSLINLGDGRRGIIAENREVVTQRGVAVVVLQAEADEADEFRALDRVHGGGRKELRKQIAQLFAETHSESATVEKARRRVKGECGRQ